MGGAEKDWAGRGWRKSSHSKPDWDECVEVMLMPTGVSWI